MACPFEVLDQVAGIIVIEARHHSHRTRLHLEGLGRFKLLLCKEADPQHLVYDILEGSAFAPF